MSDSQDPTPNTAPGATPTQAATALAPKRRDRTWMGLVALVLVMAVAAESLRRADNTKPVDWLNEELTYIPSGNMLKPMALDFDEVVADLIWIRGMIYFADAYLTGKSYKWLGHIIDVVTTLNPRLHQAYEFAGVVLTKEKAELPKTLRILERGIGEFQNDWKLRLYAAMGQLALDSNYNRAAEILKPIADQEDVPGHIKTMCARLIDKGGNRRVALAFLVDRYLESSNPISRELFTEKLLKLYEWDSPPTVAERKRMIKKILREAEVEPMAEFMALELLADYLNGGEMNEKNRNLMQLLGENVP